MFDPRAAEPALKGLAMGELMKRRSALDDRIVIAEAEWMAASEALELLAA